MLYFSGFSGIRSLGDYAYAHGLINLPQKKKVNSLYNACEVAVKNSGPVSAKESDKICNKIEEYIVKVSGGANVYDIRKTGEYLFPNIEKYLDKPDV